MKNISLFLLLFLILGACQLVSKGGQTDQSLEARLFSKAQLSGKPLTLHRAVIIDVRSRFQHEVSRPPRSFHAYWKDWDLRGYQGERLERKKKELQRLLALHGIDPLTQVVIMGEGLKGRGEEFLLASTLYSLGLRRLRLLGIEALEKTLRAHDLPPLENLPSWELPLGYLFVCQEVGSANQVDWLLNQEGSVYFTKDLELKDPSSLAQSFKGKRVRLSSPQTHWSYGVALSLRAKGLRPCVL